MAMFVKRCLARRVRVQCSPIGLALHAFGPAFFSPRISWFKGDKKLFAIPFVPTSLRPNTHRTIRFALRSFYKRKS